MGKSADRTFAPQDAKGGCDIVPNKTALVCIEYQNEFVTEGGKLYDAVKECLLKTNMLAKTVSLADDVRAAGGKVFHVPICFKPNASDNPNKGLGILAGCAKDMLFTEGTWNAEIAKEMGPKKEDVQVVGKKGLDAFPGTNLEALLVKHGIETVALCGLLTNCCIESTMRTACEKGFNVVTVTDCGAATSVEGHDAATKGTFGMFSLPMTAKDFAAKINKYTLMTIQPTFTVSDWAAAEPIMAEFVEATKKETGCIYYGWSTDKSNNKLFCREAYIDAAAALAHLENIGALVGKLLESAATLDQIELHGPAAEVEKCKEKMDGFGTKYFAIDSGFSCMVKDTSAPEVPQTIMTIQPTFTVSDWAVAEPIMAEFVEATKKETGCIYYGWTRNDDKLFCREAYVDAAASLAHLENIGALVGKLLESAATLDQIEFHGPAAEVEKCKE